MKMEEKTAHHGIPSDMAQVPIVWRYELLKYLRSKRIVAAVAIVLLIMALIYVIPPALGHPYKGTDTQVELRTRGPTRRSSSTSLRSAPSDGSLPCL
ncbi:MAG: hypothetical protein MUE55_05870 [Thermoplasmata archaeon]|nr:hypothetical protein [Thermoplasmata archaeon]